MKLTVCQNYGPVQRGREYLVISEGYDHKVIKCQGKSIAVPNTYFGPCWEKFEEEIDYEIEMDPELLDYEW